MDFAEIKINWQCNQSTSGFRVEITSWSFIKNERSSPKNSTTGAFWHHLWNLLKQKQLVIQSTNWYSKGQENVMSGLFSPMWYGGGGGGWNPPPGGFPSTVLKRLRELKIFDF